MFYLIRFGELFILSPRRNIFVLLAATCDPIFFFARCDVALDDIKLLLLPLLIIAHIIRPFLQLRELWKHYSLPNTKSFSRLAPTFDILAFYVDPREGQVGFSPHRDRQPLDVKGSFFDDGMPKYLTRWIAVEDADGESNSAIFVIPKQYDPGYTNGDDDDDGGEGDDVNDDDDGNAATRPLRRALPSKESYQNIRALHAESGSSLLFSHRIIHWGNAGNPETTIRPRIAISFTYSDPAFEAPYLNSECCEFDANKSSCVPAFSIRLLLCCCQVLVYHQRLGIKRDFVMMCYDYVKENGPGKLEKSYESKVLREFVGAVKGSFKGGNVDDDDDSNDSEVCESDEERMLEEMLNQHEEFHDDFDDDMGEGESFIQDEDNEDDEDDEDEGEFDDNELGEGPIIGSFPKRRKTNA